MKTIEKAMNILERNHTEFKDRNIKDNYYIEIEGPNDDETVNTCMSYCFKCGAEIKTDLDKKYPENSVYLCRDRSCESESFNSCYICNDLLETSLIFSNDELSHWEEFLEPEITNAEKYELYCLFESFIKYFDDKMIIEYQKRLDAIAEKIIEISVDK